MRDIDLTLLIFLITVTRYMEWLLRALTGQVEVSEDDDDECIG